MHTVDIPNADHAQRWTTGEMKMRKMMLCFAVFITALTLTACNRDDSVDLPYSPDFVGLVESGKLSQVTFMNDRDKTYIMGTAKLDEQSSSLTPFKVTVTELDAVMPLLEKNQVSIKAQPRSPSTGESITMFIPFLFIILSLGVTVFLLVLALRLVRAVERIAKNTEK